MIDKSFQTKPLLPVKNFLETSWERLPAQLQILWITTPQHQNGWLTEAFAADSAAEIELTEVTGVTEAMVLLRDELFDVVLINYDQLEFNPFDLVSAIRTGSRAAQPILILGSPSPQEQETFAYEAGADGYVCINTTMTRTLIWQISKAIERQQLIEENEILKRAKQQRLEQEKKEAAHIIQQQQSLLSKTEQGPHALDKLPLKQPFLLNKSSQTETVFADLPPRFIEHYRELLRTYVIMGSGNLHHEIENLAKLLTSTNIETTIVFKLHLHVVNELIQGLGCRSARHILNRADLLILEMLIHLAESYRSLYEMQIHPYEQKLLPGFDGPLERKPTITS